jgi:hypothetical protein
MDNDDDDDDDDDGGGGIYICIQCFATNYW